MLLLAPRIPPALLRKHAVEIAAVAPGLGQAPPTLTDQAPPHERTRWYSRLRTRRIAHGIVDLLRALEIGEITFTGVDHADATDVEFLAVARQRGLRVREARESTFSAPESAWWPLRQGEHPIDAYRRAIDHCMAEAFYEAGLELAGRAAAVAEEKDHYWVRTQRADFLFLLGRPEEVEPIYYDLLARTTAPFRHMSISYALAMLYTRLYGPDRKDHQRARAHVNTAIAIATRLDDPFHLVFLHNGKALVEMHLGNLEESLRLVTEGIVLLDEKLPPGKHVLHRSVLRHNRGQVLAALGRDEEALADFDHVIGIDPNYPEYRFDRANLLNRMGRYAQALADYEYAMGLGPPFAELYYNRGDLRCTMGDVEGAIEDFRYVLDLEPEYTEARVALASLLPAAEAADVIRAGPADDARLHCALGLSLMELRCFEQARQAFGAALKLDPALLEALVNRAVAGYEEGEYDAAIADLTAALDLDPGHPDVLFNRGYALEAVRRFDRAMADYRLALLDPRADRDAILDGLARCEAALGVSERLDK